MTAPIADQSTAAELAAVLADSVGFELATHFTCTEANLVARFLAEHGYRKAGQYFLHEHSTHDDEGDEHFNMEEPA